MQRSAETMSIVKLKEIHTLTHPARLTRQEAGTGEEETLPEQAQDQAETQPKAQPAATAAALLQTLQDEASEEEG